MKAGGLLNGIAHLVDDAFYNDADVYPIGNDDMQINDQHLSRITDAHPFVEGIIFFPEPVGQSVLGGGHTRHAETSGGGISHKVYEKFL